VKITHRLPSPFQSPPFIFALAKRRTYWCWWRSNKFLRFVDSKQFFLHQLRWEYGGRHVRRIGRTVNQGLVTCLKLLSRFLPAGTDLTFSTPVSLTEARDHFEVLWVDGNIILKLILEQYYRYIYIYIYVYKVPWLI
jgi:hypothetical protein